MENTNTKIVSIDSAGGIVKPGLLISGELFISGCSLFGTEIHLYDKNELSQKYICCLNGFFYFKLDYEKNYTIKVMKNGYQTKTIEFNTSLFGNPERQRYYEFGVTLSPVVSDQNNISEEKPAAIIKYMSNSGTFEHDREYMKRLSQPKAERVA